MSLLDDIKTYSRFMRGLPGYLSHRLTQEEALAVVRRRLQERESNFLRLVAKGIYGYPQSPYLPLFRRAGCELGDLENSIRSRGLESTLRSLKTEGVYIAFEEFKGREPIRRGGEVFTVKAKDFDNPYLGKYYYVKESGGTTGPGTRVATDLENKMDRAPHLLLMEHAHGLLVLPSALWFSILPGGGFNSILTRARIGHLPERWFSPVAERDLRPSLKYRMATRYLVLAGRLTGVPIPWPETVYVSEAAKVSRWAAETLKRGAGCLLATGVSLAARVALAAREEALDLTGAVLTGGGEPPTPTKVRQIRATGARFIPNYFISEAGAIGFGCAHPIDDNDHHLMSDALALIQDRVAVPGTNVAVDGFYLTSLLATAPKLLLNVEADDFGIIESRSCGCFLEECGFTEHVRDIQSIRKLTGEGMTVIGSDITYILEEVLPGRFGGTAFDYQLVEEEDEEGFTRVCIVVSPGISLTDERAVVESVLATLRERTPGSDLARAIWSQAKTLRVKRAEPRWTARTKFMPLGKGKTYLSRSPG